MLPDQRLRWKLHGDAVLRFDLDLMEQDPPGAEPKGALAWPIPPARQSGERPD